MKRVWLILLAGLCLGVAGYMGFYLAATARGRALTAGSHPELEWLKTEFHLDDTEFTRICGLHEAYVAGCAERCHKIDMKNEELRELLASTNRVTPEIERTILEATQLRAECQKQMLAHFYEVSQTMPPAQGKRYLAWVQERTVLSDSHSGMHH